MDLIKFIIYAIKELKKQGFKRGIHRIKWALADPLVLWEYFNAFTKKTKALSMEKDRRFVRINNIIAGHQTYPSRVHKIRINRAKKIKNQIGVSIEDMAEVMPSDKPIQAVKKLDKYFLISGNGRVSALKEAGFIGKIEIEVFLDD